MVMNTDKFLLVFIIRKFKEDDKITEEQYGHLYLVAENVHRVYCIKITGRPTSSDFG